MTLEDKARGAVLFVAGLIATTALTEGAFWVRHRINKALEIGEVWAAHKHEDDRAVVDSLEYLCELETVRFKMQAAAYREGHQKRRTSF